MGLAIAASTNARYENYEYSSCGTSHGAMKSTGTRISSKSSVPDNCIILKGEASLKYFVYQTKSFLNFGKERDEKIIPTDYMARSRGILKLAKI